MKKLLLFLLLLLQVACSQNDKSPIIKVEKVRVDRGKVLKRGTIPAVWMNCRH